MTASAPRIDPRLLRVARRLARHPIPIAEVHRAVGQYAARSGLVRPSYQQIRLAVNARRARLADRRAVAELLLAVDLNTRPATDLRFLLEGYEDERRPSRR